jgi:hypothetical protein
MLALLFVVLGGSVGAFLLRAVRAADAQKTSTVRPHASGHPPRP